MKTIKTIKLVTPELLGLAYAVRVTDMMIENGKEAIKMLGNSIKDQHEALCDANKGITMLFWKKLSDSEPLVMENTSALCYKGEDVCVEIYDEKLDGGECECDECESMDNVESDEIESILGKLGLETSDEHVERLADDIKNKRGGMA